MATYDSKYYYERYKSKKSSVKTYEKNISALQKIRSALTDNLYDEIRNVNNELDALMEDLKKAVRHNATFTNRANAFGTEKEKAVTADETYLSVCENSMRKLVV